MGWLGLAILGVQLGYSAYRYFTKPKKKTESPNYGYKKQDLALTVTHDIPVPVVYGECLVQGNIIFKESTISAATDFAVGICEGEIDSIKGVYVNGKALDEVTGCSWDGYTGTAAQTADARFSTNFMDIAAIENTVVNSGAPGNVYDWQTNNRLEATKASGVYKAALVKFDLSALPLSAGSDIGSATLRFYVQYAPSAGTTISVYEIDTDTWHDRDLTWDDVTLGDLIDTVAVTTNVTISVDVSSFVQAEYDNDKKVSLFLQIPSGEGDDTVYLAPNSVFGSPDLLVEYTPAEMANFRNTAYVAVTMVDSEVWNGRADDFKVSVRGKKISHYSGGWTTGYNNNPAYCILDQLTNSRYGADISSSFINTSTFISVASYCDEIITNEDGTGEKRATCDVIFDSREMVMDRINDILASFAGYLYYVDGKICLGVDCSGSSAHAFTEDSIAEGSFQFGMIDKSKAANDISVMYVDAANGYQISYVSAKNQSLITAYGRNFEEIPLYAINRYSQASRMAMYYMSKVTYSEWFCSFTASINHCDVVPGDICTVTHSLAGWTAKTFRVVSVEESDQDEFNIYCEEYDASLYSDSGIPYDPNSGSHLPNPTDPPPTVTGLTLTETHATGDDGTYIPQIKVEWAKPDYQYILRYIVWYKLHAAAEWTFWELSDDTIAYINVNAAGQYDVRVQSENQLSGVKSDFGTSPSDTITLAGKTTPPSDVSFNDINCTFYSKVYLEWLPITDDDLDVYELRTDTNWGNATKRVFVGKATSFVEMNPAAASITYYIKAKDLSGNYSNAADSITMSKSAPVLGTIVVDFTGKDCILSWDHDEDEDFKYYQVKVFSDAARTVLIRTEKILSPPYVYKFELNVSDNSGTPIRHPYFSIKKYSAHSQYDNDNCDGANAAPSAPADLTLTAGQGKLFVSWTALADSDIIGYNIYAKTTNPPDVLVGFVNAANFTYDPEGENTYYVQVAGVDAFGEGTKCSAESQTTNPYALTNYSLDVPITSGINYAVATGVLKWTTGKLWYEDAEYTIAAETTGTDDEFIYWDKDSPNAFQHSGTAPALDDDIWVMAYFDGTDVYSAFAQKIIHGGLIQADSIEASKLSVDTLSAITADLGTVTSGTLQTTSAASTQYIKLDGSDNTLKFVNSAGVKVVEIDDGIYSGLPGIIIGDDSAGATVGGAIMLRKGTLLDMTYLTNDGIYTSGDVIADGDVSTINVKATTSFIINKTKDIIIVGATVSDDRTYTIPEAGGNASFVMTAGAQTVNGVKTFGSFPVTPSSAPTTDYQAANKKYVDDNVGSASAHAMLSATHNDSTASAVSRGSIITGQGATPKWAELNVGTSGQVLKSDGTDIAWANNTPTPAGSDTHVQYNNGGALGGDAGLTFDDAHGRLAASSVRSGDQDYFDTSTTDSYQDGLLLQSSQDAGENNLGASIAFARHNATTRHAAIVAKQTGSDADQIGLAIYTHSSATESDAMISAVVIDHTGAVSSVADITAGDDIVATDDVYAGGDFIFNRTNDVTVTAATASAARTYTIPEAGTNASFVMTELAQTVKGVKTFGSFPLTPSSAPTTDYQAANKKYVDDSHNAGGSATEIQYNSSGVLSGDATFIFTNATDRVTADNMRLNNNVNDFDTSSTDNNQDCLLLVNGYESAGSGNCSGSIGFSGINAAGRRAAIAAKQCTADADQMGISIYTHPSATAGDAMVEAIEIDHNGNIHLLNGSTVFKNLSWSLLSGKLRGTADPSLAQMKTNGAGSTGVYVYAFDWGSTHEIFGSITVPLDYKAASTIYPHINRMMNGTPDATKDVFRVGLEFTWCEEDGTMSNTTVNEKEIAIGAYADSKLIRSELTPLTGTAHAAGSTLLFRFYREAVVTGTETELAMFVTSIDFEYESDRLGSDATTV